MKSVLSSVLVLFFATVCASSLTAQLSASRIAEIAEMKVDRFQNILDLSPVQATQLRKQTVVLLTNQSNVASSKDILAQISANLETYYSSLSSLAPQQLSTLRLFDSLDRAGRRDAYADLMDGYGQSSEFAVALAAYTWNVVMPILVSYRKDLDRYVSPEDQAAIAAVRDELIAKYNFMTSAREQKPSAETESIVSQIQADLLTDLQRSVIPSLLKKYDERLASVRSELKAHERKVNEDLKKIYDEYVPENAQMVMKQEADFINTLGISKLLRDAFFLLLDGDSRAASFKISALHLMANETQFVDQF